MQLTILRGALILLLTVAGAGACSAQSSKALDLDPGLTAMLARDSACEAKGTVVGQTQAAQAPSDIQALHNSSGRNVGIIATVEDACHCSHGNCAHYVYVKSGQTYRLALKQNLALLRPLKGFKQSMPALSGKMQVSDSAAETIIYEWSGGEYQPGICATVVQESGGHPLITKHACAKDLTGTGVQNQK
ncbi:MAG: hypothetical protein WAN60_19190 [Candidatus Sulfotelmatobacter sp.]